MARKFAHEIVLDYRDGTLSIDGTNFPFHIMENPEIVTVMPGAVYALEIGVMASNVTVIGMSGKTTRMLGDLEGELQWARQRAKEIAYEQMEKTLTWLAGAAPR